MWRLLSRTTLDTIVNARRAPSARIDAKITTAQNTKGAPSTQQLPAIPNFPFTLVLPGVPRNMRCNYVSNLTPCRNNAMVNARGTSSWQREYKGSSKGNCPPTKIWDKWGATGPAIRDQTRHNRECPGPQAHLVAPSGVHDCVVYGGRPEAQWQYGLWTSWDARLMNMEQTGSISWAAHAGAWV